MKGWGGVLRHASGESLMEADFGATTSNSHSRPHAGRRSTAPANRHAIPIALQGRTHTAHLKRRLSWTSQPQRSASLSPMHC